MSALAGAGSANGCRRSGGSRLLNLIRASVSTADAASIDGTLARRISGAGAEQRSMLSPGKEGDSYSTSSGLRHSRTRHKAQRHSGAAQLRRRRGQQRWLSHSGAAQRGRGRRQQRWLSPERGRLGGGRSPSASVIEGAAKATVRAASRAAAGAGATAARPHNHDQRQQGREGKHQRRGSRRHRRIRGQLIRLPPVRVKRDSVGVSEGSPG